MNHPTWRKFSILAFVILLALAFAMPAASSGSKPGKGVSIQPMGTGRPDQAMIYEILKTGLEELGYKVKTLQTGSYAVIHLSLGQGDADFTAVHWDGLHQAYYNLYNQPKKIRAWYIFELNTIYVSATDINENMLAHEMAHAIIDNFLSVRPPSATAEILARYVDKHLYN